MPHFTEEKVALTVNRGDGDGRGGFKSLSLPIRAFERKSNANPSLHFSLKLVKSLIS